MYAERRRHPRVTGEGLRITGASPVRVVGVVDLSLGGMLVEVALAEEPAVGSKLEVTLVWRGGELPVEAIVRHVRRSSASCLVGTEFAEPDELHDFLADWIRRVSYDDVLTPPR